MIENLFGGGGGGGGTVDTVVAGTGISVNSTDPANPIITNTSLNTDEVAKVSSNDTTAGYLNGKLVAGSGIALTENNNGGNETLGIAVSNLDASAITAGTIGTARLATGTANSSTYLRGDQTWASVGETTYTTTIADAENTNTKTTITSFTIPANTWADGDFIELIAIYDILNSSGGTINLTTFVSGTGINEVFITIGNTSNASAFKQHHRYAFVRVGNTVVQPSLSSVAERFNASLFRQGNSAYVIDNTVDFTTDITIKIEAQWASASPSAYVRTDYARAVKITGGTT